MTRANLLQEGGLMRFEELYDRRQRRQLTMAGGRARRGPVSGGGQDGDGNSLRGDRKTSSTISAARSTPPA
jgi:hypothetical protein